MSDSVITLHRGGASDLESVMEIMRDSFDPRYGEAWTESQCAGLLPLPGVWLTLARQGPDVVGFALSRAIANEAELLLLAVRRSLQGQGIGKSLLQAFVAQAKSLGADRLHLEVREGNHAVKLYEQFGFGLVGRRRNYYSGPAGQSFNALTLARIEPARD